MAPSKVNRDNYIVIQGWMLSDLKLKGNDLIIYACIYGFSQADNQSFSGSLQYLADWTNSTKQGVMKSLKSLVVKGYLEKKDTFFNGVKFCEYRATKFNGVLNNVDGGMQQSLPGGMQQSLPNNLPSDNPNNNNNDKPEKKKESKRDSFDQIIGEFTSDPHTIELLQEWLKVRKAKRAAMTDKAIQLNIDKLAPLAQQSGMDVNTYLENVIARGWASFFEIKQYGAPSKPNNGAGSSGNVFLEIAKDEGIYQ